MPEYKKLQAPTRQKIIDSYSDNNFDDVLSLVEILCAAPTVVLNFADSRRVWKKIDSKVTTFSPEDSVTFKDMLSYCDARTLVVQDINFDQRFLKHPLISHDPTIRFYAVTPLLNLENGVIGMLHILSHEPKTLTVEQIEGFELVAKIACDRLQKETDTAIEIKKLDDNFHKQQEFSEAVFENLGDGIVACDENGRLTVFNKATREFHGLSSRADIPPERWSEYYSLLHADGKTPMMMDEIPLRRAFHGEVLKDAEMVVDSIDGGRRNITCSGRTMLDKAGNKLGAVVTLHDITAVKKANAKIEASRKMLQALVDKCPVGIAVFDLNEKIQMWNPGNEKIFGWKSEEVIGFEMPYKLEDHRQQVKKLVEFVRSTKTVYEGTRERYRKDDSKVDIQFSLIPLLNEENEIYGYMAVFIDISDIKQREANLLESNRALEAASVAKSEFLANMSHEIRTPLNGVIGMTDLVMMTELTPEQREHLHVAQSSANNLLAIVSDILDFSKIEAGKLDVENVNFDVIETVNDVYETLKISAESKNLVLIKKIAGSQPTVFMGDPGRVRQVLLNLVSNAIKFSDNGEVETSVSFTAINKQKTLLRIDVKDTGLGIPKQVLDRLFQPFSQADSSTTRKFGGTGLGLSISKGLIDLMKGQIGVESKVGSGSNFWFTLELENVVAKAPPIPIAAIDATSVNSNQKVIRILMAEDNTMNQKIALAMLTKLGYTADIVDHGRAAVEALKKNNYDLILMDCQMPEMDGYEATKAIRTGVGLPNDITIIAVTANAMVGDREKCLDAGMTDYITKPLRLDVLKEALMRHLYKTEVTKAS